MSAGESRMVARLPGLQPLAAGEGIELAFDPAAVYLFDADSGVRLPVSEVVAEVEPC